MPTSADFISSLFKKLKRLDPEVHSPSELYYAIHDACGEWLEANDFFEKDTHNQEARK